MREELRAADAGGGLAWWCVGEEGGMEGGREGKEGGTVLRWGGRNPSSLSSLLSGYRERS